MTSPQTPLHTSPRTELTTPSTTGQRDDDVTTAALPQPRSGLGLTFTQVAGSSLAAVSSALAASFLGVAGTISGALVGSLIGTVGTAVYAHSLHTAGTRMRTLAPVGKRRPAETSGHASTEPVQVHGPIRDDEGARRIRWRPVAAIGAGVAAAFIIALGAITVAEKLLGHPVSSASGSGTTIGSAVTSEQQTTTPTPTATTPATATPTTPTTAATTSPASPTATTARTSSPGTASVSTSTTPASPIPSPTPPAIP